MSTIDEDIDIDENALKMTEMQSTAYLNKYLEKKMSDMAEMMQTMSSTICNLNTDLQGKIDNLEVKIRNLPSEGSNLHVVDEEVSFHPRHSQSLLNFNRSNRNYDSNTSSHVNQNMTEHRYESNLKIKPQPFDGTSDLSEYLIQFNIISELNGWSNQIKALYLASSLTGSARSLLGELTEIQKRDFESLVEVMRKRYGTRHKAEIFRSNLKSVIRQPGQSITELAQQIKKLTRQAYPDASSDLTEILALDAFVDSLDNSEIRLRLRECCPTTIAEAETIAVRLETHRQVDKQRLQSVNVISQANRCNNSQTNIDDMMRKIDLLTDKVEKINKSQNSYNTNSSQYNTQNNRTYQSKYSNHYQPRPKYSHSASNNHMNRYNSYISHNNNTRTNTPETFNNNFSQNTQSNRYNNYMRPRDSKKTPVNDGMYQNTHNHAGNGQRSSWGTTTRPN